MTVERKKTFETNALRKINCLEVDGAQGRSRTADTAIFSRMLYQLSYLGNLLRSASKGRGGVGFRRKRVGYNTRNRAVQRMTLGKSAKNLRRFQLRSSSLPSSSSSVAGMT